MVFKIILTVFFSLTAGATIGSVDQPRNPIGAGPAILNLIFSAIIIYGIWNWM